MPLKSIKNGRREVQWKKDGGHASRGLFLVFSYTKNSKNGMRSGTFRGSKPARMFFSGTSGQCPAIPQMFTPTMDFEFRLKSGNDSFVRMVSRKDPISPKTGREKALKHKGNRKN